MFVFPSLNEAFPLVNLEAIEFKLPIVASDVGGVTAEIKDGENGFVCEPGNTNAFVESISKLLDNSDLRKKMGEDGYKKFKEKFTLESFENRFTQMLQNKIGGGKLTLSYFHGKKYNEDKKIFFENADIFIFPTLNEAFGLVLLEAMQHHLPCVSTTEGGIPGIIDEGKTGFLVPKHDAETLANKIEFLLTDSALRKRMGEAGREKFEKEFTLEVFEKRMAEILKTCV